jgi:FO synthase subunit 2
VVRRAKEAWDYGATEVCIQAGLPPQMEGDLYIRLCGTLKDELPQMHIHGFSPEEVLYGSVRSRCTIREYLERLKAAGVGSLPGTSAEILDQELRDRISPGRIRVDQWTEVITTAHELGIPTTSTVMFGHVETNVQIARHIALLREIQQSTGGFTEFVPLSFVSSEAPMFLRNLVDGVRAGPTGMDVVKVHAIARIMLNNWIPNIQASWVKEGSRMSQILLTAGVNDLGGTLINESISTSAGAQHGQLMRPSEFRQMIREAGRIPAERYTTYGTRRVFSETDEELDPLDLVGNNVEELFGSYQLLVQMDSFRFQHPKNSRNEELGAKAPAAKPV